jgi:hypothetical protein
MRARGRTGRRIVSPIVGLVIVLGGIPLMGHLVPCGVEAWTTASGLELSVTHVWDGPTAMLFGLIEFGGEMYVGGIWSGDIYRSTANGTSWAACYSTAGQNVRAPSILDGSLYFSTADAPYVYRTTNGAQWSEAFHATDVGGFWDSAVFKGSVYYGGVTPSRVYASSDGSSFTKVFDEPYDGVYDMLATDDRLYIAVMDGADHMRFYSTWDGTTWQYLSTLDDMRSDGSGLVTFNDVFFFASNAGNVYSTRDFSSFDMVYDGNQCWCLATYRGLLFAGHSDNNADQEGDANIYVTANGSDWELAYDSLEMKSCSFGYYSVDDSLYFTGGSHWNGPFGSIYRLYIAPKVKDAVDVRVAGMSYTVDWPPVSVGEAVDIVVNLSLLKGATAITMVGLYDGPPSEAGTPFWEGPAINWTDGTATVEARWAPASRGFHEIHAVARVIGANDTNALNDEASLAIAVAGAPARTFRVTHVWDSPTAMLFGLVEFGGEMYVGGMWSGEVYRSTDSGSGWESCFSSVGEGMQAPSVLGGCLYFSTQDAPYIYRTLDGAQWTEAFHATDVGGFWDSAVFRGSVYYGGVGPARVYASSDGSSFTEVFDEPYDGVYDMLATENALYIAVKAGTGQVRFYSTLDGTSWQHLSTLDDAASNGNSLVRFDGAFYYASTTGNVYRTRDFASFDKVYEGNQCWCLATYEGMLFAGHSDNSADQEGDANIYYTEDGENWALAYDSPEMKSCSFGYYSVDDSLYLTGGSHWNGPYGSVYRLSLEEVASTEVDVGLTGMSYNVTVLPARVGEPVDIVTSLAVGSGEGATAMLSLYDGAPSGGALPFWEGPVVGWTGGTAMVEARWVPTTSGIHQIHARARVIDATDTNALNDEASMTIAVAGAHVWTVMSVDSPASAMAGADLVIGVQVSSTPGEDLYITIQLLDPASTPYPTTIHMELMDRSGTAWCFVDVAMPEDGMSGTWHLQLNLLAALPSDGGWSLMTVDREVAVP